MPGSDLIGSFTYRDLSTSLEIPPVFSVSGTEDAYLLEALYILRARPLKVIAGAGHYDADGEDEFTTSLTEVVDNEQRHTKLYLYSQIDVSRQLSLTLGAGGDFLDDIEGKRNQFNPKLGLTWTPVASTTLRAAVFRMLQPPNILADNATPTIEPTQVAGFNQFFFGAAGQDAWRYGVGIDHVFAAPFHAGFELSKRDLKTSQLVVPDPPAPPIAESIRGEWAEHVARAYVYWAPHPRVTISGEYLFEGFEREPPLFGTELIKELQTHRASLMLRYFHPCGLMAQFGATYVDQDGEFARLVARGRLRNRAQPGPVLDN